MLSKEACKACWLENPFKYKAPLGVDSLWTKAEEEMWLDDEEVECHLSNPLLSIHSEPPEGCPRLFEHAVAAGRIK